MLAALAIPNLIQDITREHRLVDSYEAHFECIPDKVSFRPPRVTPWPRSRAANVATDRFECPMVKIVDSLRGSAPRPVRG